MCTGSVEEYVCCRVDYDSFSKHDIFVSMILHSLLKCSETCYHLIDGIILLFNL